MRSFGTLRFDLPIAMEAHRHLPQIDTKMMRRLLSGFTITASEFCFPSFDSFYGVRYYSNTCRPGAGLRDRRGLSTNLSNIDLRARGFRQEQGLCIRAHVQPNASGFGAQSGGTG